MKRRILTVTLGLILISSLAYAAKKKELAKAIVRPADMISEEEDLETELLDSSGDHQKVLQNIEQADSTKIISAPAYRNIEEQLIAKQP